MKPHIINMDVRKFTREYSGDLFHAALMDGPYNIDFMNKGWDNASNNPYFDPSWWTEVMALLHPGAFVMAFAATRTYHRLAVAVEDAGFVIHPMIGWVFGSGFPKATRIDSQVEPDQPVVGRGHSWNKPDSHDGHTARMNASSGEYDLTQPQTPLGQAWQGHRYGLQALKPALEPILVAQKPYNGRPVDNIAATGAGALNIDGARVPTDGEQVQNGNGMLAKHSVYGKMQRNSDTKQTTEGRWPANLVLDDAAAAMVDEQSGESVSTGGENTYSGAIWGNSNRTPHHFHDSGGASRFFTRANHDPVFYTAKASKAEREAGLWDADTQTVDDGRQKSIDNPYQRGETQRRNVHPTVKPVALTEWMATLLLPPDAYAPRRLLIPFAGVGSEMIGAMFAGWEIVVGVEREAEYVAIARERLDAWYKSKRIGNPIDHTPTRNDVDPRQLSLFKESA